MPTKQKGQFSAADIDPQPGRYTSADVDSSAPLQPIGLPLGTSLPQLPGAPTPDMQTSALGNLNPPAVVSDFAKGVGKGVVHTMSSADNMASKIPGVGKFLTTPIGQAPTADNSNRAMQYAQQAAVPHNTAQSIGRGVEQAAEFMIPGGAEESAVKGLASVPQLAKYMPLAKAGVSALGAGAVNKIQGGTFGGGAVAGAGGSLIGQGLQKLAPMLAETALGVRAGDRAYGRTPGQAIMQDTTGIKPGDIAQQAYDKVGQTTNDLNTAAMNSPNPVNLQPARANVNSLISSAAERNNKSTMKEVSEIGSQLDNRGGVPIAPFVSAHEGLALRRGVDDLQSSWNPATTRDFSSRAVSSTRQLMNDELENAIPNYRDMNSKISTLLPIAQRAGAADLNAGVMQRALGRFAKPTGALVGAATGGGIGYKEGGTPGAIAGATAGLFAPELITSPTTMMMGARALASPALAKIPMTGAAMQFGRNTQLPSAPVVEPQTDNMTGLYRNLKKR